MKRQELLKNERTNIDAAVAADIRATMKRKEFESELRKLQVKLVRLQTWVKATGARIIVIFEGRDTAGKGGVISRITQRVSPRVFKHVALPAPTEREKSQLYIQRYIAHLPAAGEIVLFDRSWYNRAGVERVMGFCTEDEYERFMRLVPSFEKEIVDNGIILLKYFLDVSQDEQRRRFADRIDDPVKHWKLSPMDTESVRRWWDYTRAYQNMLRGTDTPHCPWYIVSSDDKRRARLNLIAHMLDQIPYKKVKIELPKVPKAEPRPKGAEGGLSATHIIPAVY
jgi:polyphosphate kinase